MCCSVCQRRAVAIAATRTDNSTVTQLPSGVVEWTTGADRTRVLPGLA
jgi:hypothetical protein